MTTETKHLRAPTPETLKLITQWLSEPEVIKWLDFGYGKQALSSAAIYLFLSSPSNFIRVCHDDDGKPYGFICLQGYQSPFKSASIWAARGTICPRPHRHMNQDLIDMFRIGFEHFGLRSISSWVVSANTRSLKLTERVGFREVGRQRQCHVLDGVLCDRIHFDIVADEFFSDEQKRQGDRGPVPPVRSFA